MVPECLLCDEAITNPLCKHCLQEEVNSWLADFDESIAERAADTADVLPKTPSDIRCMKCGEEMSVCPHCYAKEVLRDIDNKVIAEKFTRVFDFELR
ncbi:MAG: hypothetical protein ACQEP1_06395 [Nanobdellota archaeon]